jgi:glucuronate isomerase
MSAMPFIHDDFLLHSPTARRLYHEFAADQPILDFHNHLPPADIAGNRQFKNLFEIWLEGDHYKWRAMRSNGVPERLCTGNAEPIEKFSAWAATVPQTIRNPLYHWTHLELKRYFDIDVLLDEKTAPAVWRQANERLATPELSTQGILKKFRITALCTTDDPVDNLESHRALAASALKTRVYPAFRPDKALAVQQPESFNAWIDRLAKASDVHIAHFSDLLEALRRRHDYFHQMGSRLSDHGLEHCYADFGTADQAAQVFDKARSGKTVSPEERARYVTFLMVYFGQLDAAKGWTKQLHLGALRNNSTRRFQQIGPDTGFDSIGDWPQARALSAYLDRLEQEQALPKIIIYNINPADNYVLASMLGNFQDGVTAGKIQFGSGWWFLDQKEGMEWQLNALSNLGLLSRFVGMLTDSRSFMSFPRHEYFRRVLCNLLGRDVENGEIPAENALLGPMIQAICYGNARSYLGLAVPEL